MRWDRRELVPDPMRFIGIDAGGSSTRAVAVDAAGDVAAEARGDGANPLTIGIERAAAVIAGLVQAVDPQHRARSACAGVAGSGGVELAARLAHALRAELPWLHSVWIVSDAAAALRAAGVARPAVVVIAGTGSIAYGETANGAPVRAGGYGAVIGDGGAFAAGIAAIGHAARVLDGVLPGDALSASIEQALDVRTARELIDVIHAWPPDIAAIAALANLVGDADEAGLAVARAIVDRLGADLGAAARTVCGKVRADGPLPVTLAGGAFDALPRLASLLRREVERTGSCAVERCALDGARGAAFIAMGRSSGMEGQSTSQPHS